MGPRTAPLFKGNPRRNTLHRLGHIAGTPNDGEGRGHFVRESRNPEADLNSFRSEFIFGWNTFTRKRTYSQAN